MRQLNAIDMLNVWEQGLNQPLLQRALILLVAARPEIPAKTLAELSIGQRDQQLLQLRERLFGSQLVNTAVCPACFERLEWENKVADMCVASLEGEAEASESEARASTLSTLNEFELDVEHYHIHFRLPNSLDIAAAMKMSADQVSIDKVQNTLLTRCIINIEPPVENGIGENHRVDQLPDHVIEALEKRIEALDPQAKIQINLSCPSCSHHWEVLFDIVSFLWSELNDWAERTLQMIHTLAKGYGWSEQEILNLSPIRRQLYLGMLRS